MQKVLITLGDPVVASSIQEILKAISVPAILDGFNLSAGDSDLISVSPGVALTDSGVLIQEDEVRNISFNPSVQPGNFTIFYRYVPSDNFGGNPASLNIQSGLIPQNLFENGVLLGWLQYPGGSVPLANDMFVSAKRVKLDQQAAQGAGVFQKRYAPFSYFLTRTETSGPFLVLSETYDGALKAPLTVIQSPGGAVSTASYILPFQISPYGLGKISVEFSVTSAASVGITVMKSDGTEVSPVETNFFIDKSMGEVVLSFAQSNNFVPNQVAYVKFDLSVNPGNNFSLKSFGHSAYTEPF